MWNHVDPDLQQFVNKPGPDTKVTDFIDTLEDLRETWELRYQRKSERKNGKTAAQNPSGSVTGKANSVINRGNPYNSKMIYQSNQTLRPYGYQPNFLNMLGYPPQAGYSGNPNPLLFPNVMTPPGPFPQLNLLYYPQSFYPRN